MPTLTPFPTDTPFPTATPYPTATATEIAPTETDVPTKIPYVPPTKTADAAPTSTPVSPTAVNASSSSGSTPVTWKNETSHSVEIVAKGSATYTLNLAPGGEAQVNWAAGDYSVNYYLDGNTNSSGSETITVSPEIHNLLTVNFR